MTQHSAPRFFYFYFFFRISKCHFKNSTEEHIHKNAGDSWRHRRLGRVNSNLVPVLHSCWPFVLKISYPEGKLTWTQWQAVPTLRKRLDCVSKCVRWSHYDNFLKGQGRWQFELLVQQSLGNRRPLGSWSWDTTRSREAASLLHMPSTTAWVSALPACKTRCKKASQREHELCREKAL